MEVLMRAGKVEVLREAGRQYPLSCCLLLVLLLLTVLLHRYVGSVNLRVRFGSAACVPGSFLLSADPDLCFTDPGLY